MAIILKNSRRNFILSIAVCLCIIAVFLYVRHHSRFSNPVIPSTNPLSTSQKTPTSGSTLTQQDSPSRGDVAQNNLPAGPPPVTPSGDFVSNHRPGGGNPTSEASTCNTSPKAVCYIQFTKGNVIKKLDTRTADDHGAVIWYWDVKSAGLTEGSWTITAVATLNGQIRTDDDALQLMVQ